MLLLVNGLVVLAPVTEFVLFSMLFDSDNGLLVLGEQSSLNFTLKILVSYFYFEVFKQ